MNEDDLDFSAVDPNEPSTSERPEPHVDISQGGDGGDVLTVKFHLEDGATEGKRPTVVQMMDETFQLQRGELVNLVIDSLLVNCVEIWLSHSSSDSATSVITACDKHHYKSNGDIKAVFRVIEPAEMTQDVAGNIVGVVQQPKTKIGLKFLCCSSEPHNNGGSTTSRQDWVLNIKVVMDGNIAIIQQWKVQVVATPGRKTRHNGPVAGPSSANIMNDATAVENVQGGNDDQLNAQLMAMSREDKIWALELMKTVRTLKRKATSETA